MNLKIRSWLIFIVVVSIASRATLLAQEKWLDDQTVAVARLSVEQPEQAAALLDLMAETAKPVANEVKIWKDQLTSFSQTVQAAGGKELVIVYSMADPFTDQPLLVFPGARAVNLDVIGSTFICNGVLNLFHEAPRYKTLGVNGDTFIGTALTLMRIGSSSASVSKPANERLSRPLVDSVLTFTLSLNPDQRRAVSEMIPALPGYLGDGKVSDLLADVEAIQIDVAKSQQLNLTLIGKTDSIEARLKSIQAKLASSESVADSATQSLGKFLVDQIVSQSPQRKDNRLTWSVQLSEVLKSELGVALGKAMLESDQMTAMQRIKYLGLAIHNHESAYKKFPTVTLAGEKPRMLSWRVDLLPFLGYQDLWKEFHRDESWDSEHNMKLIPRMPDVFRCPQSKYPPSAGLSTFALPVHEKAMWSKTWQTEFKGITDGTSNTIMTIEVRDELAQVWTKPDPLEVDLSAPEKQFGGHFEGKILFGAGDGSAGVLSKEQFKNLPALITRAGGEVVSW